MEKLTPQIGDAPDIEALESLFQDAKGRHEYLDAKLMEGDRDIKNVDASLATKLQELATIKSECAMTAEVSAKVGLKLQEYKKSLIKMEKRMVLYGEEIAGLKLQLNKETLKNKILGSDLKNIEDKI